MDSGPGLAAQFPPLEQDFHRHMLTGSSDTRMGGEWGGGLAGHPVKDALLIALMLAPPGYHQVSGKKHDESTIRN